MLLGGIEGGGTKYVLGVGTGPQDIRAKKIIATTTPDELLGVIFDWFNEQPAIDALGIGNFGPICVDPARPDWGCLGPTPKSGWQGYPFGPRLREMFGVPIKLDSDVNAAAIGEARWGAGRNCPTLAYVTVGTGIGGSALIDGKSVGGVSHSEMGHIPVRLHEADHGFAGACAVHGNCLEGLASGPAIRARWGMPLSDLPPEHPGHAMIAFYIGELVATLQAMFSPQRIILGGGVMKTPGLIERVRTKAAKLANGYFAGELKDIVVPPELGDDAGLLGAFALAEGAIQE